MKGKKWVLEPRCVEVDGREAKVNLFEVTGGWVVPVTFGPAHGTITVTLRNVDGMKSGLKAYAMHPGSEARVPVVLSPSGDGVRMVVGTRRGCAVVRIEKGL
jgi:hypothetical protein